jgi:hypothetical protein
MSTVKEIDGFYSCCNDDEEQRQLIDGDSIDVGAKTLLIKKKLVELTWF